jgi:hypothetical protein
MHAVPVSRFTRLQESRADTSNEWFDFTRYRRQTRNYAAVQAQEWAEQTLNRARRPAQSGTESTNPKSFIESIK